MDEEKKPAKKRAEPWYLLMLVPILLLAALIYITVVNSKPLLASDTPTAGEEQNEQQAEELLHAVLPKTLDAGQAYIDETLFVGDSNTLRLYLYGLLDLENVAARTAAGIEGLAGMNCVLFEGDDKAYTVAEALETIAPRRIVMTFGTNNIGGELKLGAFIAEYRKAIAALQKAYPYCDIIVNAIPPIAEQNSYPNLSIATINHYNAALLEMCRQDGLVFLNSHEALVGEDGYAKDGYTDTDGIHLNEEALRVFLRYVRTHALDTEDTRPALPDGWEAAARRADGEHLY